MVKYFESRTTFYFSWDQVAQGFWKKYPNPESGHVLTEDTVHREIRGHTLFSKRLLTKTNRVPKWGERFIGAPVVKIVEESLVDPKAKTLTTYQRNIGYNHLMNVIEKVVYTVHQDNPNWTVAERTFWVDSQVRGFGRAIQAFGMERMKKNCSKMAKGFNYVLSNMFPSPGSGTASAMTRSDKIKDAAKKASELAKAKAGSLYATCETN